MLIGGDLNAINTNFSGLTTCTNFTSPNGFIYTLEADTSQFNGCITGGFSAQEAEIEILVITNRITVENPIPASSNELTSKSYVDNLLNSYAKLSSANNFTGLQTIVGDLKADNVLVKNTTPTLTTHLISKLYVDTALNTKQNTLIAGENITITNNTISSTGGGSITQEDLDLKQNTLVAGTNISISGNTISSTGGITQAQLDTKQNTLTSSTNILTSRIDVSDKLVTTGTSPTLYLKDTNNRSGMIHMNSDRMYFLSGVANSESWSQVGNRWALQLNTSNNFAEFGGNIYSPGTVDQLLCMIFFLRRVYEFFSYK